MFPANCQYYDYQVQLNVKPLEVTQEIEIGTVSRKFKSLTCIDTAFCTGTVALSSTKSLETSSSINIGISQSLSVGASIGTTLNFGVTAVDVAASIQATTEVSLDSTSTKSESSEETVSHELSFNEPTLVSGNGTKLVVNFFEGVIITTTTIKSVIGYSGTIFFQNSLGPPGNTEVPLDYLTKWNDGFPLVTVSREQSPTFAYCVQGGGSGLCSGLSIPA